MKKLRMILSFPFVVVIGCIVLLFHSIKSLAGDLEDALLALANMLINLVHQTESVKPDAALFVGEAICDAHDSFIKSGRLGMLPRAFSESDADWKKWVGQAAIEAVKELS
jgi:hypothetical protein